MSTIVFLRPRNAHQYSEGQCWEITNQQARLIDKNTIYNHAIPVAPGADLIDALTAEANNAAVGIKAREDYTLLPTSMGRGKYFPRICRKIYRENTLDAEIELFKLYDRELAIGALKQEEILLDRLEQISKFIYPHKNNLDTYGHEIRNQLILACTEVEAQLRGILAANKIPSLKHDYGTPDFVRLLPVLKLNEYAVRLISYPALGDIRPFADWTAHAPTKSIGWYDAYNAVKHDRETQFHQASLRHAIEATIACAVVLAAQFGRVHAGGTKCEFSTTPQWTNDELYLPPAEGNKWEQDFLKL